MSTPTQGAQWFTPEDSMEVARQEFELMLSVIQTGGRVVVGTDHAIPIGDAVIRVERGEAKCSRRATRGEFIEFNRTNKQLTSKHCQFYYEIEVIEAKL